MKPEIHYLNTDLDLIACRDLNPLAAALDVKGVFPLHVTPGEDGRWYASFETHEQHEAPEETLSVMLDAIESLTGDTRSLWSECSRREFNIGYDCGEHPWAFNNGLSNSTLLRAGTAGASLRITLYPPEKSDRAAQDAKANLEEE